MNIDNQTGLFTEIEPVERYQMMVWAKTVVLTGKVPRPDPKWLLDWMTAMEFSTREQHYQTTTTFAQKLMLSLILDGKTL